MKKFIINSSLFIGIAAMVYVLLINLFGHYAPATLVSNLVKTKKEMIYIKEKELDTTGAVDVLILGSSRAYRGYDPRLFAAKNLSIYNLGSSSQSPLQTKYIFNRYIDRLKPKTIIYDIFPEAFYYSGLESNLEFVSNGDARVIPFYKINDVLLLNTYIYNLFNPLKGEAPFSLLGADKGQYVAGGYVDNKTSDTSLVFSRNEYHHVLRNDQFEAFESVVKEIRKRNIRLILIQSPITTTYYNHYRNNDSIDQIFRSKGEYHNFNDFMHLPYSCFIDYVHMNQRGVDTFNKVLLQTIKF